MTLSEAMVLLDLRQLASGAVTYDVSVTSHADTLTAKVVSQFPLADSTQYIPAGSAINLVLSLRAKE